MSKKSRQKSNSNTDNTGSALIKWCDNLIFALLAFTVFIIPVFFNINSFDQFEMPKLTFLRILTAIMLGIWAVKIIEKGKFEFTPTPLDFPMAAWVLMNIITTFTSFAPHLSFRGEYENFAGSLSNINYVILYYIAVQNIKTKKQVFILNTTLLATGFLITVYALAQFFGYDFIKWSEGSMIKGRYFASMGNPNFLGAVLIMIIPVNISFFLMAVKNKKLNYSAILFVSFILLYIALFGTQSRGPFLGFGFSALVFIIYGLYRAYGSAKNRSENKSAGAVLALIFREHKKWVLGVAGILVVAAVLSLTLGNKATMRLLHAVTHPKEAMKISRLHIWVPSLKMIADRPVLGTGVDTFKSVFPQYEGTEFAYIDGANVSSRTAHNEPLNIAATMGLTSLGIYLLLIWAYLRLWAKSFRRISDFNLKMLSLGMFSGFTAYFIQNLFSFGVAAINTTLYLFFAMHVFIYMSNCGSKTKVIRLSKEAAGFSLFPKIILQSLVIIAAGLIAYKSYSFYSADVHYNKGKLLGNVYNKWDYAVKEHLMSVDMAPGEVKYHVYLGLAYERLAMQTQDKETQIKLINLSIESYKKGVELNPGNAYYWGNLGRVYTLYVSIDNNIDHIKDAIRYYEKAIEKAPVTGLFYHNLIDVYLKMGMVDRALPYYEKLRIYDRNLASNVSFMIANIYFQDKKMDLAEKYYEQTIELNPSMAQAYHNLGITAAAKKDAYKAKVNLEKFLELDPNSDMAGNARKILKSIRLRD